MLEKKHASTDPHSEVVIAISLLYRLFPLYRQDGNRQDMKKLLYSHPCSSFLLLSAEYQAPGVEVGTHSPQLRTHIHVTIEQRESEAVQQRLPHKQPRQHWC